MKIAWLVLLITALTDFTLTFATGLSTAMATSHVVGLPDIGTILIAALGGVVVASRTVQQALKATPTATAELKGQAPPIIVPATATSPAIITEQVKP